MEATKTAERRICARTKVEGTWGEGRQGFLASLGLGNRFRLKILDLSQTGMRVVACHPMPLHSRYSFMVEGGKRGNLVMDGRIVWSTEVQQATGNSALHGFLAGVEFPAIRTKQADFLRDLAEHRRPKETKYRHG